MSRQFYQKQFDQVYKIGRNEEESALSHISNRIAHSLPVDCIDAEQMKKIILGVNVRVEKDLSPEEAAQLLQTVKGFLIHAVDSMVHYEVERSAMRTGGGGQRVP